MPPILKSSDCAFGKGASTGSLQQIDIWRKYAVAHEKPLGICCMCFTLIVQCACQGVSTSVRPRCWKDSTK